MTTRARAIARPHAVGRRLTESGGSIAASHERPLDRSDPPSRLVTHDYAALAFHTAGHSRLEQNGEHRIAGGDVVIVPAGQPHRMLEMQRSEYWGLAFCAPCFTEHGAASLLGPLERVRDGASPVVRIPSERHPFLESLFRELGDRPSGTGSAAIQWSLLTLILAEIERAMALTDHAPPGGGVVVDSLRFIERNCLRRLTVSEIARAVGRTPTYVTAALKDATGKSAGEWIVSGRMAEARRLLSHSDEHVEVIAERVGYADATHFIRMFRREHGATPAAWRAGRR